MALAQGSEAGGSNQITTPPSGFESAAAEFQSANRYRAACRELRTIAEGQTLPANSTLRDFSNSPPFQRAIIQFCISGDFILRANPDYVACTAQNRMKLDGRQAFFILSLNKVSDQNIGRIELNCIEMDSILRIDGLEAFSLRLINSKVRQIFLAGAKISFIIEVIENSEVQQGFGLTASDVAGPVNLKNSRIGYNETHRLAAGITESKVRSVNIEGATIEGNLHLAGINIETDMRVTANTAIKGSMIFYNTAIGGVARIADSKIDADVNANSASVQKDFLFFNTTIGGKLDANRLNVSALWDFNATTVTGETNARFVNVGSISITKKSVFKDNFRVDYARVASQVWIEESEYEKQFIMSSANVDGLFQVRKVTFKGVAWLNYAKVRSYIAIEDSQFSENLNLEYARIDGNLSLERNNFGKSMWARFGEMKRIYAVNQNRFGTMMKPEEGGGFYLQRLRATVVEFRNSETRYMTMTGSNVGEVFVEGSKITNEIFLGNSRFNVLDIKHTGRDDKRVESEISMLDCSDCVVDQYILLGAKISRGARLLGARVGTLTFSEDAAHSSWDKDAVLDLTGVQAQVVQAKDTDLRVLNPLENCPGQLVRTRLAGVKFDSLVTGRVLNMKDEAAVTSTNLLSRPVAAIRDWMLALPSCWDGKTKVQEVSMRKDATPFDPQPFEMYATALERSGRPETATQFRILKRDEEINVADYSLLRRGALFIGRTVVSYGYENENAIGWFVLLWLVGIGVYMTATRPEPGKSPPKRQRDLGEVGARLFYGAFYSIDRAVPQLTLDKSMDRYYLLHPGARYYFYIHRMLGTIIVAAAIAGLTGVLK